MVSPFLSKDESVILASDKVMFRSVSIPALVLTNKRILLIRTEGESLSAEEIPVTKLRSAVTDEQTAGDPVLRLSFVTSTGEIQDETLTFVSTPGKMRNGECREWTEKLSEQITPSLGDDTLMRIPLGEEAAPPEPLPEPAPPSAMRSGIPPATGGERAAPPEVAEPPPESLPAGEIFEKHERLSGLTFPAIPPVAPEPDLPPPAPRRSLIARAALVFIIIAIIAGAFLYIQYFLPTTAPAFKPAPAVTPFLTTVPATVPTTPLPPAPAVDGSEAALTVLKETASPEPTPTPALSGSQIPIPRTGSWVHIQYAGNYTGSIGERGNIRPVSGTGERFYQLFAEKGTVRAIIQKGDGSSRPLTIDLYQDGALLVHGETSVPLGEVNIQTELITATPAATAVPATTAVNATGTG